MSDLSEHIHTLALLQDRANEQAQRLIEIVAEHFQRQDAEMAELRDEIVALSNRIEAVTRAQVGSRLHSVSVQTNAEHRPR